MEIDKEPPAVDILFPHDLLIYTISMFGFDFRQIPCLSASGKYCGHRDRQLSRSLALERETGIEQPTSVHDYTA